MTFSYLNSYVSSPYDICIRNIAGTYKLEIKTVSGKTITLNFTGYKSIFNTSDTINTSGIYCIYAMTKNSNGKLTNGRLIYIGEGAKVKSRLSTHNRLVNGKQEPLYNFLKDGENLYYSVAAVPSGENDRLRAEAALIFEHQPIANTDNKSSFNYPKTTISTSGMNHQLQSSFTVE